ncbi:MAG: hypothetical protein O3A81_01645, partial [bacterium]|nr:hypothetical protein [bacterium]
PARMLLRSASADDTIAGVVVADVTQPFIHRTQNLRSEISKNNTITPVSVDRPLVFGIQDGDKPMKMLVVIDKTQLQEGEDATLIKEILFAPTKGKISPGMLRVSSLFPFAVDSRGSSARDTLLEACSGFRIADPEKHKAYLPELFRLLEVYSTDGSVSQDDAYNIQLYFIKNQDKFGIRTN